jgi:hypothetical protein
LCSISIKTKRNEKKLKRKRIHFFLENPLKHSPINASMMLWQVMPPVKIGNPPHKKLSALEQVFRVLDKTVLVI